MAKPLIVPVILSGGTGSRLWPLSREAMPKQLQPLIGNGSTLLQQSVKRFDAAAPIVVCNHEHQVTIAGQLAEIGVKPRHIVVEPQGRNTAPAACVAALLLEDQPGALMLVMPSDHLVGDVAAFREAVARAADLAQNGLLVALGVTPTSPNTGYGYMRRKTPVGQGWTVEQFIEKPNEAIATGFLASGDYLWNSGIFLFPAALFLDELSRHEPEMVAACHAALAKDGGADEDGIVRLGPAFTGCPSRSIDHAVMERTDRAAVMPVVMGWSDIGSWSALWQESPHDANGNAAIGDVLTVNSRDCYIRSEHQLVTAIGLDNIVVVATTDAVLVADKRHDQQVKIAVEQLHAAGREEAIQSARVRRPWGWFETVDHGPRYRVKHIQVDPHAKLSLQKHWHRSEHWVVVTGTAQVTCGDRTFLLRENESTFIPAGTVHRLENPGRLPLKMIEVQSGEYVGEDDIVRIEDSYGRR